MRGPRTLRAGPQPGAKLAEERRQPLDVHFAVEAREGLRNDQPVLQRIAGARRRLGAVAEHPPAPVGSASDVGGVEAQPALAGRRHAAHRGEEVGRSGDRRGGQQALADQRALAIQVAEDAFEQFRALLDAARDLAPFVLRDQQRHAAERPAPLGALALHAIGHAHVANVPVGGRKALFERVLLQGRQRVRGGGASADESRRPGR